MDNIRTFDNNIKKGLVKVQTNERTKKCTKVHDFNIYNDYPVYYNNLYLNEYV